MSTKPGFVDVVHLFLINVNEYHLSFHIVQGFYCSHSHIYVLCCLILTDVFYSDEFSALPAYTYIVESY